jgi:hypothetical protein
MRGVCARGQAVLAVVEIQLYNLTAAVSSSCWLQDQRGGIKRHLDRDAVGQHARLGPTLCARWKRAGSEHAEQSVICVLIVPAYASAAPSHSSASARAHT